MIPEPGCLNTHQYFCACQELQRIKDHAQFQETQGVRGANKRVDLDFKERFESFKGGAKKGWLRAHGARRKAEVQKKTILPCALNREP
jgi:hypothetical protein